MDGTSLEVDMEVLKCHLPGPDELDIDKGEQQQRLFHTFSQQRISDFLVATVARWDEHARMLVIHERKCQELSQAVEDMSERDRR